MLQTSELRIGNRLTYADKEIIVEGIVRNTIYHSKGQFDQNTAPAYEPFKGIKLTRELFLKYGFTETYFGYDHAIESVEIEDLEDGKYIISINFNEYNIGREFEFLHELQNIFFCLVGKELASFSTEP